MTTISLLIITMFSTGCYSYKVAMQAQPGTEVSKTVSAHSYFRGLVQKSMQIHTPICDSPGVYGVAEVTVNTNLGFALITVTTLGVRNPVRVE